MPDPFDTLSLPARPWIDQAALHNRFRELASQRHPDSDISQSQEAANSAFCELNDAHRAIQDPVTRLHSLLAKEAPAELESAQRGQISLDLTDHFMNVATILRGVSAFCAQESMARSPMTRAVLRAEHNALRTDVERTLARIDELWHQCEAQLQAADAVWDRRTPGILHQLATIQHEMSILQRWRVQLREARLRLTC